MVTIYSDCSFLVKPCFIASFLHMHFKFSTYNDRIVLLFSGNTYLYGLRASQILELGVSEFCSTISNSHVKSRVCFRVLSQNSQKRRLKGWIYSIILLALFYAKFACNSSLRTPVFRWESCKGSVWENVKKCSSLCKVARTHDWNSRVARGLQAAKSCTCAKHAEKLKYHASWSTTGQKV